MILFLQKIIMELSGWHIEYKGERYDFVHRYRSEIPSAKADGMNDGE